MAGFSSPCYTPIPDELFDSVMATLSGAELKVLLYIMRRTLGFKQQSDDISLTQICNGIVKKDGTRLDSGTGLDRKTVVRCTQSLAEKNYIQATHHESSGVHGTTTFEIVFNNERGAVPGWVQFSPTLGESVHQGVVEKSYPQETVNTRNSKQEVTTSVSRDEKKAAKDRARAIALLDGLSEGRRVEVEAVLAIGMWSKFRYKPLSIEQIIDGFETCTHIEHVRLARKSAAYFEGKNQDRPSVTSLTDWWDRDEKKAVDQGAAAPSADVPMTQDELYDFIAARTPDRSWQIA